MNKYVGKTIAIITLNILLLTVLQCSNEDVVELPKDIFGISVGMDKESAEQKLKGIAKLIRVEKKGQEVWAIKNDPSFGYLALGYNKENKVRYVTAFTKLTDGKSIKPEEIGSLSDAKHEIVGPNYTYTWSVSPNENESAYRILVQGNNPENISFYSLSALNDQNEEEEERDENNSPQEK